LHLHQTMQELQAGDVLHQELTQIDRLNDKNKLAVGEGRWALVLTKTVIIDLLLQGWRFKTEGFEVLIDKDRIEFERRDGKANKVSTKSQLLQARDEQLSEPAVRKFVHKMERRRLNQQGWHSIYSLMRDGRELADKLRQAKTDSDLSVVVDPYLQFVDQDAICAHTSLNLAEVWRYFRYTYGYTAKIGSGSVNHDFGPRCGGSQSSCHWHCGVG